MLKPCSQLNYKYMSRMRVVKARMYQCYSVGLYHSGTTECHTSDILIIPMGGLFQLLFRYFDLM